MEVMGTLTIGNVLAEAVAEQQKKEENRLVSRRRNMHTFKVSCHSTNFSLLQYVRLPNLSHDANDANDVN